MITHRTVRGKSWSELQAKTQVLNQIRPIGLVKETAMMLSIFAALLALVLWSG